MASRSAAEVRAHYSNLTRDESGEYRANKYTQQLGTDPRPSLGVQHGKVVIFWSRRRMCNVHTFRASYAITLG